PQTVQTACGSFGDRHWLQATVATGVAFHCARRDRVLLRDIFRLGTATSALSFDTGHSLAGHSLLVNCRWSFVAGHSLLVIRCPGAAAPGRSSAGRPADGC